MSGLSVNQNNLGQVHNWGFGKLLVKKRIVTLNWGVSHLTYPFSPVRKESQTCCHLCNRAQSKAVLTFRIAKATRSLCLSRRGLWPSDKQEAITFLHLRYTFFVPNVISVHSSRCFLPGSVLSKRGESRFFSKSQSLLRVPTRGQQCVSGLL